MSMHTFKTLLRSIRRNALSYTIGFLCLFVGITSSLFVLILGVHEISYDTFHRSARDIYRISSAVTIDGNTKRLATSPRILAETIVGEIPEAVEYTRVRQYESGVFDFNGKKIFENSLLLAEANFFEFFDFEWKEGGEEALQNPGSVVLAEDLARRLFGSQEAMGQTVVFMDRFTLKVTGVLKNIPGNTHLRFRALVAYHTFDLEDAWDEVDVYTYVKLNPNADHASFHEKLDVLSENYIQAAVKEYNATLKLIPVPLRDIHLTTGLEDELSSPRSPGYLYILFSASLFFLFIGCCSYININMANSVRRLREIGVRIVVGADNRQVAMLFVSEFVIVTCIVLLMAVGGVTLAMTFVNPLLGNKIDMSILADVKMLAAYILIICLGGGVSALYPVFSLLKYKPYEMLMRRKSTGKQSYGSLQAVVFVQFCIAVIMILLLFGVRSQVEFLSSKPLGLNTDKVVFIKIPVSEAAGALPFKTALQNMDGVETVSYNDFGVAEKEARNVFQVNSNGRVSDKIIASYFVDENYVNSLGISFVLGRNFNLNFLSDRSHAVLVNETMVRQMGWANPLQEKVKGPMEPGGVADREAAVIGVVRDFHIRSVHQPIEPVVLMFTQEAGWYRYMHIRFSSNDLSGMIRRTETLYRQYFKSTPFQFEFLHDTYASFSRDDRQLVAILVAGTLIVIFITVLSVFGLSSLLSSRMEKEMAIRKILGCSTEGIFLLYARRFVTLGVGANIIALPMAYYLFQLWIREYAYRIDLGGAIFGLVFLLSLILVVSTVSYHAWAISRQDLVKFLRME